MEQVIPIIHARILYKIKKHSKGIIVQHSFVREWVSRMIIKKGGIPREDIQSTIEDMCNLGLLKRLNKMNKTYEIMSCKRKVREPVF